MLIRLENQQTQINLGNPVINCECVEGNKIKERTIYRLPLTRGNLLEFYEKASKHRVLFTDDINGDFKTFCEVFMYMDDSGQLHGNGLLWAIDGFIGIYYMTHIIPERDALVHFTFFDGKLKGRENITKSLIQYVFQKYNFNRLSSEIGCYADSRVIDFVKRIGFKIEGRKRKALLYKGEWFDSLQVGILAEDALKWDLKYEKLEADLQQV